MHESQHNATERLLEELPWVRALARALVRDHAAAEDLVQETCLAVIAAQPVDVARPRAFLSTVVRNVWRANVRSESARRVREQTRPDERGVDSPEELALRMERQRLLADAVLELDEPFRSTVILRYLEGLEPSEIARRQGVPAGTVRRRLKTALERLRERLDRMFDGDRRSWAVAVLPLLDLDSASAAGWMAKDTLLAGALAMKKTWIAVTAALVLIGAAVWTAWEAAPSEPSESLAAGVAPELTTDSTKGAVESASIATPSDRAVTSTNESAAVERRVSGVVVLANACGADSTLEVLAFGRSLRHEEFLELDDELEGELLARASVASDGSFTLAMPAGETLAHLAIRGRTLYLPSTVEVDLAAGDESVELRPLAGVVLRGTVVDGERALVGRARVRVHGAKSTMTPADGLIGGGIDLSARADEDGAFELCALPAELSYALFVAPSANDQRAWAAQRIEIGAVHACETRELAAALTSGAVVSGRVVDPDGEPVEGARVFASFAGRWMGLDDRTACSTTTGSDGEFELRSVPPFGVRVRASAPGWLESHSVELACADGRRLDGLELALGRGVGLRGRVQLADGAPAPRAEVSAQFDPAYLIGDTALNATRGTAANAVASDDGSFELDGLGAGPFTVRARWGRDEGEALEARVDGVKPEGAPVVLTVHEPFEIAGAVVDARGAPVQSFRVDAARIVESSVGGLATTRVSHSFANDSGRFELTGLEPGRWLISARAPSFATSKALEVAISAKEKPSPLELVLVPAAVLAGVVLDPDGAPAAGARVVLESDGVSFLGPLSPTSARISDVADGAGRFRIECAPGVARVRAHADSSPWLASERFEIDVSSGAVEDSITLMLRRGARLTGEAFDDQGRPAVGDMVAIENDAKEQLSTAVGADGRFELAPVPPGTWNVIALELDRAMDSANTPGERAQEYLMDSLRFERVELVDDESVHVVLGSHTPSDPVRVSGKVLANDEPRPGGWVLFFPSEGGGMAAMKFAQVGKDGTFATRLDRPGSYSASVPRRLGDDKSTVEFEIDVPAVAEHQLELDLPGGAISGVVFDPSGAPAADAYVSATSEGSTQEGGYSQGVFEEARTDSAGRFEFDSLRAGVYTIAAGGASAGGARLGRVAKGEIELQAGEAVRDLELRTVTPGSIVVRVRGEDGEPIGKAAVFFRGAGDAVVNPLSKTITDSKGRAEFDGLAPGAYTVLARAGQLASRESSSIDVTAEGTVEIELVLSPATMLRIKLRGEGGAPARGWVHVNDKQGRGSGGMYSMAEVEARFFAGHFSPSTPVLGPLPPGRYRIEASAPGGLRATREVTLSGEPEKTVRVTLER